jgi:hypothetical protein
MDTQASKLMTQAHYQDAAKATEVLERAHAIQAGQPDDHPQSTP